jgi:hypothetical protein
VGPCKVAKVADEEVAQLVNGSPSSIIGSFHQISTRHLGAYLDEIAFRFNNRNNPYLFRDTVLKLLEAKAMPYSDLIRE